MKNIRSKDEIELHNYINLRIQIEYPTLSELEEEILSDAIWKFMCGFNPEKDPERLLGMCMSYVQLIINSKLYKPKSLFDKNELIQHLN